MKSGTDKAMTANQMVRECPVTCLRRDIERADRSRDQEK